MSKALCRCATGLLPALILVCSSATGAQDADSAATLVALAGRYVADFEERHRGIVGEEHQTQRLITATGVLVQQRTLVSDVVLAEALGYPLVFRDVIAVDGTRVRDREERLRRLFLDASRDPFAQARAVTEESRRYDIDFTHWPSPLFLPLMIVAPGTSERFRFSTARDAVMFDEVGSPTLMRAVRDIPLRGRLVIDASSGALRSVLLTAANTRLEVSVSVNFVEDARLEVSVPLQMRESYHQPKESKADRFDIVSDYSNFRRFEVASEEQFELPE